MSKIKLFENFDTNPIDIEKLKRYSLAINTCCNGEYGEVYYNEKDNHVYVCLGDSSPFDCNSLENYMQEAIAKNWESSKRIKITIENESGPNTDRETGWKKLQKKDGTIDFYDFSY